MFRYLTTRVKSYRDYRTAIGQLSQMSRHELEDIGITPGDIERVARGLPF